MTNHPPFNGCTIPGPHECRARNARTVTLVRAPMTSTERIAALIAEHEALMARILAVKPAAADGRSDGRRVRYVRAETAAATLRAVLALIDR